MYTYHAHKTIQKQPDISKIRKPEVSETYIIFRKPRARQALWDIFASLGPFQCAHSSCTGTWIQVQRGPWWLDDLAWRLHGAAAWFGLLFWLLRLACGCYLYQGNMGNEEIPSMVILRYFWSYGCQLWSLW